MQGFLQADSVQSQVYASHIFDVWQAINFPRDFLCLEMYHKFWSKSDEKKTSLRTCQKESSCQRI